MKNRFFYFLSVLLILSSCNKDDESGQAIDTFHEDYYDVNILPVINNFNIDIETLNENAIRFKETISLENFNKLQEQWLKTVKSFAKTRVYNMVDVKAQFFDILIYNFPVSSTLIEANIAEQEVYNTSYLNSKSSTSKGLGALEYLLYGNQDSEEALLLLQNNTYRVDYVLGVTQEILRQSSMLIDFWEQNYKEEFINARSMVCTENARCLAFNQLINILDVIRVTKVGKPAGLENSSGANLKSLEAFRSGNSLKLIKTTIEEVEHVYSLSTVNFSSIVDDIAGSSEISKAIKGAFTEVYTNIDRINISLYSAIENNNPNVEALYNALFNLVKYFSVDAASILSVTVLPTDNDGD